VLAATARPDNTPGVGLIVWRGPTPPLALDAATQATLDLFNAALDKVIDAMPVWRHERIPDPCNPVTQQIVDLGRRSLPWRILHRQVASGAGRLFSRGTCLTCRVAPCRYRMVIFF